MSDQQDLYLQLKEARPAHPWQELHVKDGVWEGHRAIVVTTGPDDAAAVFMFDSAGNLTHLSVVEAHGEEEARCGPG
jgi:hypothetical protein